MKRKKKDNEGGEENDPFAGTDLSDEEKEIIRKMLGDAIPPGAEVIIERLDNKDGYGFRIFDLVASIAEDMAKDLRDPGSSNLSKNGVLIAAAARSTMDRGNMSALDFLWKSLTYGIAAGMGRTVKELLEEMSEHAPDYIPNVGAVEPIGIDKSTDGPSVKELEELFNLPAAEEPQANDDNKEEK